jgi:hypothetical protein
MPIPSTEERVICGNTRDGWGVFDESGFRLQESPYLSSDQVPFTVCELGDVAIAIVVDYPRTSELHARLNDATRPAWIDAIGQATRTSPPDAKVADVDADLVAPADFDRRPFAVAAAIVLFSHGLFDRVPERYQVRVGDQSYEFVMTFDDDTEMWCATDV